MDRNFRSGTIGLLAVLLLFGATSARASHRTDFFDISRPAEVVHPKDSLTWTLRNRVIERQIQFDPVAGALRTVALRDLRRKSVLEPAANSEGRISFVPALRETPKALTGWKALDVFPPSGWAQPGFDDSQWADAVFPLKSEKSPKNWWLRAAVPADLMEAAKGYALVLDNAFDGEIAVYVDGVQKDKLNTADQPSRRYIQVDLTSRNRVIGLRYTTRTPESSFGGAVGIAEVGSAPNTLDLSSDWKYMLYSVSPGEDNSRILTLHLNGLRKHDGFFLEVSYQIYAGEEPTVAKWFTLTNHRQSRYLVDQVQVETWQLPAYKPETLVFGPTGYAASNPSTGDALFTAVISPLGASEPSLDGRTVTALIRPNRSAPSRQVVRFPAAVTGFYHGPPAKGAFLYQLYTGQYVARAGLNTVGPVYNTRYGYGTEIDAATCEKVAPMAADLGAKVFALDDGWQTNLPTDGGRFGDYAVDKSAEKFPTGLEPITRLLANNGMQLGLWVSATQANEASQTATEHPNWALRQADNSLLRPADGTIRMCFTSGWEENLARLLQDAVRWYNLRYVKVDGPLLEEGCFEPAHDHPTGHAVSGQLDHWASFAAKLHRTPAQTLKEMVLNRGQETGPEVTAIQDEGWAYDWDFVNLSDFAGDVKSWFQNADLTRRALYDACWARPPFTLSADTPCHVPTGAPDLEALEYHFVSAGAYVANVELQGRLDEMTPPERDLIRKWVQWNQENRPWLAYAQPLGQLGKPWDPRAPNATPHVDGVLHLRNLYRGRYGYLCLFNPSEKADKAEVTINPLDYFVRMDPRSVEIVRIKDGKPVPFSRQGDVFRVSNIPMAPRSWEIFEIRTLSRKPLATAAN